MADAKALFMAEFGHYFAQATPENPVGGCARCLTLRTRDEVDGAERCPAELLRVGLGNVMDAQTHDWQRFTDGAALEQFVKDHIAQYRTLVEQAAALISVPAATEDDNNAG